jgi:hypothetical protein
MYLQVQKFLRDEMRQNMKIKCCVVLWNLDNKPPYLP